MCTVEKALHIISGVDYIAINSCTGYRQFVYDPEGYMCALSLDTESERLGQEIHKALDASYRIAVEDCESFFDAKALESRFKIQDQWLKKVFKVSSAHALELKTIGSYLTVENGGIGILSYQRKNGNNVGDESPENWTRLPLDSTPEEIGRAVKLALTKCRGRGTEKIHERFKELGWE